MVEILEKVQNVDIGIIGGSGLYSLDSIAVLGEVAVETPWGIPSDNLVIGQLDDGTKIAFLARHGRGHYHTPTSVPFQANIAALKSIGCKVILAFSAVGSLREEIKPKDFVLPDQIIDRTKGIRQSTYFDQGLVGHVMFADPFTRELQDLIQTVHKEMNGSKPTLHTRKTLICMEGPAFSTRAESHMYRSWGGDIINMSAVPEAKLAREAGIIYFKFRNRLSNDLHVN
jgi:5'-methylthioadenosine phosphorylase